MNWSSCLAGMRAPGGHSRPADDLLAVDRRKHSGRDSSSSRAGCSISITISEAEHAIHAGRLDQARLMIGRLVGQGAKGLPVEHLIADMDFASGRNREALTRYQQLLTASPNNPGMNENAGIAALRIGEIAAARPLIESATAAPGASWRAWNARGVLADLDRDWKDAGLGL